MNLWCVTNNGLVPLRNAPLARESRLEDWLVADLSLIGLDAMPIGRQVPTPHGGRIDILALHRGGDLVVVEIKRDRTPRDIVAQMLDYASWVRALGRADIEALYRERAGAELARDYPRRFEAPLPERLNAAHRLLIVASGLDPSTRRIVRYLAEVGGLAVNTAIFRPFRLGEAEILAFDWLIDPDRRDAAEAAEVGLAGAGLWFAQVSPDPNLDWEANRRHGYVGFRPRATHGRVAAGLGPGDWFFAHRKGEAGRVGYVGLGEALGRPEPADTALVEGKRFLSLGLPAASFAAGAGEDEPLVLPVRWITTVPEREARQFKGMFVGPSPLCRLTDAPTLEFLKQEFGG